jgi:enoyl-CoA hydratase/carnithine racemase
VVFDSADPDFFLVHYDVLVDKAVTAAMKPGRTGLHPWLDVLVRLSTAPVLSVASIRGRARGAGSELALACDVRFGSRERCILAQFEVGVGAVPGGGPMARLARLVRRGRALEIVLGADDFPGDLAASACLDCGVKRRARRSRERRPGDGGEARVVGATASAPAGRWAAPTDPAVAEA